MPITRVHPEPATLAAFATGRLGTAETEAIEEHLTNCPICSRQAQEVPDDDLVKLLRRTPSPVSAPALPT